MRRSRELAGLLRPFSRVCSSLMCDPSCAAAVRGRQLARRRAALARSARAPRLRARQVGRLAHPPSMCCCLLARARARAPTRVPRADWRCSSLRFANEHPTPAHDAKELCPAALMLWRLLATLSITQHQDRWLPITAGTLMLPAFCAQGDAVEPSERSRSVCNGEPSIPGVPATPKVCLGSVAQAVAR